MFWSLLNLLYPNVCLYCKALLLKNEALLCTICRHELPLTRHVELESSEVSALLYGRLDVVHGSALLYFHKKGIAQELIHHLKYKNQQEIGTFLGKWYGETLKPLHHRIHFDEIIPVPLHPKRLKERGYNQLTTFGRSLAETLHIPFNESLLHRNEYAITQTKKSFFERTADKSASFGVAFSESDYGKHFLIIDDVITTGATLEACGKKVLTIPNAKISIATLAYSQL